jgi:hypothetical protein
MLQHLAHTFVVCVGIFLGYALIVLLLHPFAKVASYKPCLPPAMTTRVVLTLRSRTPLAADPTGNTEACITQAFVFRGELAKTVTAFFSAFDPPSLTGIQEFLLQPDALIADIFITPSNASEMSQLRLLGCDAAEALSYLAYCSKYQLVHRSKKLFHEPAVLTQ